MGEEWIHPHMMHTALEWRLILRDNVGKRARSCGLSFEDMHNALIVLTASGGTAEQIREKARAAESNVLNTHDWRVSCGEWEFSDKPFDDDSAPYEVLADELEECPKSFRKLTANEIEQVRTSGYTFALNGRTVDPSELYVADDTPIAYTVDLPTLGIRIETTDPDSIGAIGYIGTDLEDEWGSTHYRLRND